MTTNTTSNNSFNTTMQPPRPPNRGQQQPNQPSSRPPKKSKPAAQRPAFRQKVASANQTAICTTTSQRVGRRTLREVLHPQGDAHEAYSVPIFQRRYCWNETQWDTLWHDVRKRRSMKHSLGRLTCTNALNNQRSIIIDGQQRFTTTTLLLAAFRDALLMLENNGKNEQTQALIQSIHEMLFLNPEAMDEWISSDSTTISEGLELDFCRLIPTFCDRSSYLAAILPQSSPQVQKFLMETYRPSWHRPIVAKQHFARKIQSLLANSSSTAPFAVLEKLTNLLLDGIDILYFPIDVHKGYQDGTEDTQVIYERLAIRDATWCKPSRTSEYHSMGGTDMIRNLCLGSFHTTASKKHFYETYWLPLERMFQTTSDDDQEEESLKQVIGAFVQDPSTTAASVAEEIAGTSGPRVIGGKIYHDFEIWTTRDLEHWQQESQDSTTSQRGLSAAEAHTMDVGRRLLQYATHRVQSID